MLVRFSEQQLYGRTSAFVAIRHAPGCPVVSGADDSLLPHDNAAYPALHAVAAECCQVCELHEVLIPAGSEAGLVGEVK